MIAKKCCNDNCDDKHNNNKNGYNMNKEEFHTLFQLAKNAMKNNTNKYFKNLNFFLFLSKKASEKQDQVWLKSLTIE